MANEAEKITSLDQRRASQFFQSLVADPFVAVIVTDDGEVCVYSKGLEPEHLARIREVLSEIEEEDGN